MSETTETEQSSENEMKEPTLDGRALKILLEGIDLAFKRGAFNANEAAPISAAYTSVANTIKNANIGDKT